jgi:hypothetical protein
MADPWRHNRGFVVKVYAIDPSRAGSADKVAEAVSCSAAKDAVWIRKPRGVLKSRSSVRVSTKLTM